MRHESGLHVYLASFAECEVVVGHIVKAKSAREPIELKREHRRLDGVEHDIAKCAAVFLRRAVDIEL